MFEELIESQDMFNYTNNKLGQMRGTCISTALDIMLNKKIPVMKCQLSEINTYLKCWPMSNSICIFPENIY